MKQKKKMGRGGFTLVEVLVVMAIIAILAAITVPSFAGYIDRAKEETYLSEARNVATGVQIFITEQYAAGTLDRKNINKSLLEYPLGEPEHALTEVLRGSYTNGAQIVGISYSETGDFYGITYDVEGYRVEITPGEPAVITKINSKKN